MFTLRLEEDDEQVEITDKEFEALFNLLDDGKYWGRSLEDPQRTLLEKVMKLRDIKIKK